MSTKNIEMQRSAPKQTGSVTVNGLGRFGWFSRPLQTSSLKRRWEEAGGLKQPTHEKLYSAQFNN